MASLKADKRGVAFMIRTKMALLISFMVKIFYGNDKITCWRRPGLRWCWTAWCWPQPSCTHCWKRCWTADQKPGKGGCSGQVRDHMSQGSQFTSIALRFLCQQSFTGDWHWLTRRQLKMKIGECSPLAFAKVAGEPSRLDNPWKDHYKQNVSKMGWYQNIKIMF